MPTQPLTSEAERVLKTCFDHRAAISKSPPALLAIASELATSWPTFDSHQLTTLFALLRQLQVRRPLRVRFLDQWGVDAGAPLVGDDDLVALAALSFACALAPAPERVTPSGFVLHCTNAGFCALERLSPGAQPAADVARLGESILQAVLRG